MKNDINNELTEVLNIFKQAYIQRDPEKIDSFMETLFDKDEDIIIVGTGACEWCTGYAEAKDIFLGDWEYWGDVRINADEVTIMPFGNTALIYTTGTVKYSFNHNADTYTSYLGNIKKYFDGVSFNSKKTNKVKLTEINWTLCHFLNKWDGTERDYLWDLRISFVLIKKEAKWIIKQMQFSLPVVGHLPDLRNENLGYDIDSFIVEGNKMKEYSIKNTLIYKDEIPKFLQSFNNEYLKSDKDITLISSQYFTANNPLIINIDKTVYTNQEEIKKLIENHRGYYDEIKLDCENCLINSSGDVVWIATHGIMKKTMSEDNAFENTTNAIKDIFTSNLDDKDKLFKIRRKIAITLKENAKGEEYSWPFRFEAVIIKENDNWVFKYLQFSLPFNWFLEGKTEAATLLKKNI